MIVCFILGVFINVFPGQNEALDPWAQPGTHGLRGTMGQGLWCPAFLLAS